MNKESEMGEVKRYTQGVCMDGAAILLDGKMQTIEEILGALNLYAALRAENAELVAALDGLSTPSGLTAYGDALANARDLLAKYRGGTTQPSDKP